MISKSSNTAFTFEPGLSVDEFIDVLVRSTLAERRPVHDRTAIEGMLRKADVILTARVDGLLVGIRPCPLQLFAEVLLG